MALRVVGAFIAHRQPRNAVGWSHLDVRLGTENGRLVFEVSDDGKGFDPDSTPPGSGLTNMRDRLEALGGSVEVSSRPGEGTTVKGRIPVQSEERT